MKNICKKLMTMVMVFAFSVTGMAVTSFAATPDQPDSSWEVLSEEIVVMDDGTEWIKTSYKKDSDIVLYDGSKSVTYSDRYTANNDSKPYVELTATFKYNTSEKTVSCTSKSATNHGLSNYTKKSLKDSGEGTKCTATLSFTFNSWAGTSHQSVKVGCNYKGDKI